MGEVGSIVENIYFCDVAIARGSLAMRVIGIETS